MRGLWCGIVVGLLGALGLSGCGMRYWVCDEVDAKKLAALPRKLSETELFIDIGSDVLAPGVIAYRPAYELWSDGAAKRRWIALPMGTRIDSSDMNAWRFPTGTKLWKEFTRDGVRVETRILAKLGPLDDDWVAASYVWQGDQRDAVLSAEPVLDVLGTPHDVPAAGQCMGCHGGRKNRVLGFSAVQLAGGELDLAPMLSTPPPTYQIPGNDVQRAALGYLYANCAHCHNTTRPKQTGARCYDPRRTVDFSLDVEQTTLASTGIYRTGIDDAFVPGRPGESELVKKMAKRQRLGQMPPLASEQVDAAALELVKAWIAHP
ncbi:MAG TPA: hypothetical protein VI299_15970 [Polyangiales bacterium]